jgi:quercetin dioxygenase-like cupin family protein
MRVRRFSADLKVKLPGGHPGLYGQMIAMPAERLRALPDPDAFAARLHGLPLALEAPVQVEVMYFDPHARLDEHSAPHPILFCVIEGAGTQRLGGPAGESRALTAGDAVIWPPDVDHTVWTDDSLLTAFVVNLFGAPLVAEA